MRTKIVIIFIVMLLLVQTGQAEGIGDELLWGYETGNIVKGVSVSSDGSYIAARSDVNVYLFNRDGKLLWSYELGGWVDEDVSVSSDGSYIAAGYSRNVYIFNRDGELLWSYEIGDIVKGVSVSSDGSYVAVASGWDDSKIRLFNRDGKLLWSYEPGSIVSDVSVSPDGSYVAAGSGGNVHLFGRDGKLLWSYETGSIVRSVSVSSDGSYVAAGSHDNMVYLFNRDGKLLWSYETGNRVKGVSVSSDGSYVAAGSGGNVPLFDRDGKLLWSYELGGWVEVSVSPDGSYVAAGSGVNVYLFVNPEKHSSNAIKEVKKAVELGKSKGFNMAEAETMLSNAEDAFGTGNYAKASELADAAKASAESIAKRVSSAENAINEVESVIHQEESKGFNLVEAKSLLSHAKEAFSTGNYTKASELAENAKTQALDIDQDGVTNEEDFAPTIENIYIYTGAVILLIGSVVTIRVGSKWWERFKIESQRKEQKRRRVEEEKRRTEEAESRRREAMKQNVLDMIEEVTN